MLKGTVQNTHTCVDLWIVRVSMCATYCRIKRDNDEEAKSDGYDNGDGGNGGGNSSSGGINSRKYS